MQVEGESEGEDDEELVPKKRDDDEEVATSPTRAYLKAVSVPKKKAVRKRKKTVQDNGMLACSVM